MNITFTDYMNAFGLFAIILLGGIALALTVWAGAERQRRLRNRLDRGSATLALLIAAILCLPGCAYLPPSSGTAPTAAQETISADLDAVASAIRHAEDAALTPADFTAYLRAYCLLLPKAAKYLPDVETTYADLYVGGNATVAGLEKLAAAYDSK